jgi:hypothetical protein
MRARSGGLGNAYKDIIDTLLLLKTEVGEVEFDIYCKGLAQRIKLDLREIYGKRRDTKNNR